MAEALALETTLSRAECHERLQGRIDRRRVLLRMDPARPVRGRASLQGFVLHRTRDPVVEAVGTYRLGASGGTRIDLRFRLAWARQLPWIAVNVVVLGPAAGVVLAGSGGMAGDRFTVVLTAAGSMCAFILALQILVLALAYLVYGPRQLAFLRTLLQDTLAAS